MDSGDISRKADAERAKQKNQKVPLPVEEPRFIPSSPESWKIFKRIYPDAPNLFIWVYIILTLGVVCLTIYWTSYEVEALYSGLGLIALFLLRMIYHFVTRFIAFGKYKHWRDQLGFEVHGWNDLGKHPEFPQACYWDMQVRYEVHVSNNSQEVKKLVNDALFLFVSEANKCFYSPDFVQSGFVGDIRHKWEFANELAVNGSASEWIVGLIYRNISEYMRTIHASHHCISSVHVTFSNKIYKVAPVSTD